MYEYHAHRIQKLDVDVLGGAVTPRRRHCIYAIFIHLSIHPFGLYPELNDKKDIQNKDVSLYMYINNAHRFQQLDVDVLGGAYIYSY